MPPLLQVLDAGVLTLTLNRPDQGNALNAELIEALHQALEHAELSADVRVVALRGGGNDFSTGADITEMAAPADPALPDNDQPAERLGSLFQRFRELPKPVVAIVHGRALADGATLATACDLIVAAESATIGYAAVFHGFAPATAVLLLRRAVGEHSAFDLLTTGRILSAPEAAAIGLIARTLPDATLDVEAAALTAKLAGASGSALAISKRLLYQLDSLPFARGLSLAARADAMTRHLPDFQDTLTRFLRE